MKVSEFIQEPGKWNEDLIHQCFLSPDSQLIFTIPLSPFSHTDSWCWHYTKNGIYSVRSGYNLAVSVDKSDPSSSSDVLSAWWKAFWAIKIPRKILIFGWRGFHEILPTTKGLNRKNVSIHSNCPLCGFGEDSNAHAIFWCPFSQNLWALLEYQFLMGHKGEISFKNVLLYATELLEKESFAKMLIIAWGLWTERNKKTHGQQPRNPEQMKNWLSSFYEEIKKVQATDCEVCSGNELRNEGQTEIEIHDLSLFVDASISTTSKMVGFGAVIVTASKRVQATLSKPLKGIPSVLHAEALALLVGLRWAQTIGLPIKMIASDSLSLVQALLNAKEYHNEFGFLIDDIKKLWSNFPEATITHVSRNFNVEAHNLARHALQLESEFSWMGEASRQAVNLV